MSTMMRTQNPAAVERIADDGPVPSVGEMVMFFPRPSEIRAGKPSVPGLVLKSDQDNRRLDLLLFYEADDFRAVNNIPIHMGDDQGWERRPAAHGVSQERFEAFMAEMATVLFGDAPKPESGSMLEAMQHIFQRLDALEAAAKK